MSKRYAIIVALILAASAASAAAPTSLGEIRKTPSELAAPPHDQNQIGSSGLTGVHTTVVFGDPSKAGFYSILLFVPPHTTIAAHSHHDDRMATVVSGTWHFGYGDRFDASKLKDLPPGSVYSEPGAHDHFARTENDAVVVHISGYGPTDTHYFDLRDEPHTKK